MKYLLLAMSFVITSLGAYSNAQAENLSYMMSGKEQWSVERLEKDIQKTEESIALQQKRLVQMRQEMAERLSAIESAAANDQDQNPRYDHTLGHQ